MRRFQGRYCSRTNRTERQVQTVREDFLLTCLWLMNQVGDANKPDWWTDGVFRWADCQGLLCQTTGGVWLLLHSLLKSQYRNKCNFQIAEFALVVGTNILMKTSRAVLFSRCRNTCLFGTDPQKYKILMILIVFSETIKILMQENDYFSVVRRNKDLRGQRGRLECGGKKKWTSINCVEWMNWAS